MSQWRLLQFQTISSLWPPPLSLSPLLWTSEAFFLSSGSRGPLERERHFPHSWANRTCHHNATTLCVCVCVCVCASVKVPYDLSELCFYISSLSVGPAPSPLLRGPSRLHGAADEDEPHSLIRASDKIEQCVCVCVCVCVCESSPSLTWTPARSRITEVQFDTNPQSFASKLEPFPGSLPFKVSLNEKAAPGFFRLGLCSRGSDQLGPSIPPSIPPSSFSLANGDDKRQRVESSADPLLTPTVKSQTPRSCWERRRAER